MDYLEEMDKTPRNIQPSAVESGRNGKSEQINSEWLKTFPSWLGQAKDVHTLHLHSTHIGNLSQRNQTRKTKGIQIASEEINCEYLQITSCYIWEILKTVKKLS